MKTGIFLLLFIPAMSMNPIPNERVKVGQPAPPLSVDEWILGSPVNNFQKGTVYVVEFWGTWCSPCLKNIPKLSRIQTQYASDGLVVIGVASHEFKGREVLTSFMKEKAETITYRIAYDGDLSMEHTWDTGGREDVVFRMPLSFVIDKEGIVTFVGHPEDDHFEKSLREALNVH